MFAFIGRRTSKLESGLTLMKEDLTCYRIYKILKQRVRDDRFIYLFIFIITVVMHCFCILLDRLDLATGKERSCKTNLAFCDVELDIAEIQSHRTLG